MTQDTPYAQPYTEAEIAEMWETHAGDNPECQTCRILITLAHVGAPGGAALVRTPETLDAGTTTDCPLEGVHEHAFRGPHRFHEWDPSSYFTLNDRPPVRTPETLDEALDRLAKSGPPEYVEVAALTLRDWLSDEPSAES